MTTRSLGPPTVRALAADPVVRVALGALALGAVPYVIPILSPADMPDYSAALDLLLLLGVLLALQYGLRALPDPPTRRFWHLLTAAVSCWVVARAVQWVPAPGPTVAQASDIVQDVLYVLFYFFVVLALESAPPQADRARPAPGLGRLRSAGAAVFVFGLLVYFVIIPTALNPGAYDTWIPSLLLYVTLDVYVVARLARLQAQARLQPWRLTCTLLLVTAVLWLVTDIMEALSYLGALPADSGRPLDLAWFPPYVTLVAAARTRHFGPVPVLPVAAAPAPEQLTAAVHWGGALLVYAVAVPGAHLALYGLDVLDPISKPAREVCALVVMLALAGLAVVYQRLLERTSSRLAVERDAVARRLHALERVEAVGRLTGGIAHDLNNVFTIVLANAGLIDAELRAGRAAAQDDLTELVTAARRGTTLVKKLLGVGRRDLLVFRAVDLGGVVGACIPALRQAVSPGVQVRFSAGAGLRPVRADAGSIEQILMNLVANANDAMPRGGDLTIEVGALRVDASPAVPAAPGASHAPTTPGEYGVVRVSDTGEGMDEHTREQVFEPFFTTKPPGQGAGLGMAMVYGLVKQHGGFVEVTSAPGRGTVVQVLFPVWHEKLETTETGAAVPAAPPKAPTILVVDDEAPIRRTAQRSLERLGYRVLTAADGEEGLRLFEEHADEVALVVSDVVMPKIGGVKLRECVRRLRPATQFIFTSGYAAGDVPAEFGLDAGVPFLSKPWTIGELAAKVGELLGAASRGPDTDSADSVARDSG